METGGRYFRLKLHPEQRCGGPCGARNVWFAQRDSLRGRGEGEAWVHRGRLEGLGQGLVPLPEGNP